MFDEIDKESFLKDSVWKAQLSAVLRELFGLLGVAVIGAFVFGLMPLLEVLISNAAFVYASYFRYFFINAVAVGSIGLIYEFIQGVRLRFKVIALTREVFGKAFDIVATGILTKEQASKLKPNKLSN